MQHGGTLRHAARRTANLKVKAVAALPSLVPRSPACFPRDAHARRPRPALCLVPPCRIYVGVSRTRAAGRASIRREVSISAISHTSAISCSLSEAAARQPSTAWDERATAGGARLRAQCRQRRPAGPVPSNTRLSRNPRISGRPLSPWLTCREARRARQAAPPKPPLRCAKEGEQATGLPWWHEACKYQVHRNGANMRALSRGSARRGQRWRMAPRSSRACSSSPSALSWGRLGVGAHHGRPRRHTGPRRPRARPSWPM